MSLIKKRADDAPERRPNLFRRLRDFPWRDRFLETVHNTTLEVWACIVLAGAIGGPMIYKHNRVKEGEIPTVFSEREAIEKKFQKNGDPLPPLTAHYTSSNDVAMKVFESHNIAFARGFSHATFADELETRIDEGRKKHRLISEYAALTAAENAGARQSLSTINDAVKQLPALRNAFKKAWDYDRDDEYRTEYYTETVCSGTGDNRSCHTVLRSRQVYDYSIHTFTYDAAAGAEAARLFAAFDAAFPDLRLTESLITADATHAENEQAIRKSLWRKFKKKEPDAAKLLEMANRWAKGSAFAKHYPKIIENHRGLRGHGQVWQTQAYTSTSLREKTYSQHHDGPAGYQTVEAALRFLEEIAPHADKINAGIKASGEGIPKLEKLIRDYVGVVKHGKQGDATQLRKDIMKTARDIYDTNFVDGYDTRPFKWGMVILLTAVVMAGGAGIGVGIDRGLKAYNIRRPWVRSVKWRVRKVERDAPPQRYNRNAR